MNIQVNTDNHIAGREALSQQAEATVASALGHLAEHISRRLISQLAGRVNALLAGDNVTRCSIAISGAIHHQLLEAIGPKARAKIAQVLASNLTKTDPSELHAHFHKQLV